MRLQNLVFLLLGFLVLACNEQKQEPRISDPVSTDEDSLQKSETSSPEDVFIIRKHTAGDFKLGAALPTALEDYTITREQQLRTTEEGPTEETVYIIEQNGAEMLRILPAIDVNTGESTEDIGELRITSDNFRTEEGIGVNSTLEEFIEAYPRYKLWYTYVSDWYVAEAEGVEAQFLLDESSFIGEMDISSVMTPLSREDFKEGAKIVMVRMIE